MYNSLTCEANNQIECPSAYCQDICSDCLGIDIKESMADLRLLSNFGILSKMDITGVFFVFRQQMHYVVFVESPREGNGISNMRWYLGKDQCQNASVSSLNPDMLAP